MHWLTGPELWTWISTLKTAETKDQVLQNAYVYIWKALSFFGPPTEVHHYCVYSNCKLSLLKAVVHRSGDISSVSLFLCSHSAQGHQLESLPGEAPHRIEDTPLRLLHQGDEPSHLLLSLRLTSSSCSGYVLCPCCCCCCCCCCWRSRNRKVFWQISVRVRQLSL